MILIVFIDILCVLCVILVLFVAKIIWTQRHEVPHRHNGNYSAVAGEITVATSLTEFAGKPPFLACSLTRSALSAL